MTQKEQIAALAAELVRLGEMPLGASPLWHATLEGVLYKVSNGGKVLAAVIDSAERFLDGRRVNIVYRGGRQKPWTYALPLCSSTYGRGRYPTRTEAVIAALKTIEVNP
jgi:hypothetical protein